MFIVISLIPYQLYYLIKEVDIMDVAKNFCTEILIQLICGGINDPLVVENVW